MSIQTNNLCVFRCRWPVTFMKSECRRHGGSYLHSMLRSSERLAWSDMGELILTRARGRPTTFWGQADEAYVESYPSELEYVMTISEPGGGLRHWHRRRAFCTRLVYCQKNNTIDSHQYNIYQYNRMLFKTIQYIQNIQLYRRCQVYNDALNSGEFPLKTGRWSIWPELNSIRQGEMNRWQFCLSFRIRPD